MPEIPDTKIFPMTPSAAPSSLFARFLAGLLLCGLCLSVFAEENLPASNETPGVGIPIKPDTRAKKILATPTYDPDYQKPVSGAERLPQGWHLLQKTNRRADLWVHGSWKKQLQRGGLVSDDFVAINPPKMQAMIGLATVQTPDKAGWAMSAGPRCMVKTTDDRANYATRSYQSWASVGWGMAVDSETSPAVRMFYEGADLGMLSLGAFIDKLADSAPDTGMWMVAGQVDFPSVVGQSLRRAPVGEAFNGRQDPAKPGRSLFMPVTQRDRSGLLTAIVFDPARAAQFDLPPGFLPPESPRTPAGRVFLAHYALFRDPAPGFNSGQSFLAIWDPDYLWKKSKSNEKPRVPSIETVRRALHQTLVSRGR
ncbi:MAG: hypothetical protein ACOC2L_01425 [Candidatus Sumerlaeota bacterium]